MNYPKITVLVAVYNAEKYLRECLESLINQTLEDIEIICINDGSTDKSQDILESYAEKDSRIKLLIQENQGAPSARNFGLKIARGEYICPVDSDDKISLKCLEEAYKKAKKQDLDTVIFKIMSWKDNDIHIYTGHFPNRILTGKEAFILSLNWSIGGISICKREILQKIKYNTDNAYGDELTTRKIFYNSKKVGFSEGEYYYRENLESVTKKMTLKKFDFLKNETALLEFIKKENIYDECKEKFEISSFKKIIMTVKWVQKKGKNTLNILEKQKILKIQNELYDLLDIEYIRGYLKIKNKKLYFLSLFNLKMIYMIKKYL